MLYYITYTHIPTKKAFGYAIAKMCATLGVDQSVTLVIPRDGHPEVSGDIFDFYNLPKNFRVIELPALSLYHWKFLGKSLPFFLRKVSFALSVALHLRVQPDDICYSRDLWSLAFLRAKTDNVFLEIHYLSKIDSLSIRLAHVARKLIVITKHLKQELMALGYKSEQILVAPDAVDLSEYANPVFRSSPTTKTVLYAGNLFAWKGVYTLVDSFEHLPAEYKLVIVGGSEDTLPQFRAYVESKPYAERISILGFKKHAEIAGYVSSADLLVLPNSAKEHISKYNTSPLKLFEYMASGVPIVASDLPSLREILSEQNATFAAPDDARSLADAIKKVFTNYSAASSKARQARMDVERYDWKNRASSVSNFIHGQTAVSWWIKKARVLKFIVAGGTSTLFNLVMLFILADIVHLWYLLAAIIAFILTIIVSYLLQKFWTFEERGSKGMHVQFSKYVVYALVMLGVNTLLMYIAVDLIGIWYFLSQMIITALIATFNYFGYQKFIFRS